MSYARICLRHRQLQQVKVLTSWASHSSGDSWCTVLCQDVWSEQTHSSHQLRLTVSTCIMTENHSILHKTPLGKVPLYFRKMFAANGHQVWKYKGLVSQPQFKTTLKGLPSSRAPWEWTEASVVTILSHQFSMFNSDFFTSIQVYFQRALLFCTPFFHHTGSISEHVSKKPHLRYEVRQIVAKQITCIMIHSADDYINDCQISQCRLPPCGVRELYSSSHWYQIQPYLFL